MTTSQHFRELALAFPGASEEPHFEKISFRFKKKIFATMDEKNGTAVLKLTPLQQTDFCAWTKTACYPVPNKWGLQGWTTIVLAEVEADFAKDILAEAYNNL